jgi:type IV pilus assembly protein PilC
MRFKYEAINQAGKKQKGIVEALTKRSAIEILIHNNLRVLSLKELQQIKMLDDIQRLWEGVSARDFVMFSRQLAVLIEAKVPLMVALESIAAQLDNRFFAMRIKAIVAEIDGGSSFSDALSKHKDTFSDFYVNMVKAGEASGNLQKSLTDLADNIEKNYELTSKLKSAMYYPAFILTAMLGVGFIVMTNVMPPLLSMLRETKAKIPLQTKILMAVSDFLTNYWWLVIPFVLVAIAGMIYYIRTEDGRKEFDQAILKIPIVGKILKNIYIARFAENLATLVSSGLPITNALLITSDVVGNEVFRAIIKEAAEEVKKGGSISKIFDKYVLMPPVVVQMIHIGESTGRIDYSLSKVTDFYAKEADRMVKNFTTLIEPVIMVILAGAVGVLVSAVILPIYQVAQGIK